MDNEFDLGRYASILKRRFLYLLMPATFVFALGLAVAFLWPPLYQSTAIILVEQQQIPSDLAQSTIVSGAQERIQVIRQKLLSRESLLNIVKRFDALSKSFEGQTAFEVVESMREAVSISQILLPGQPVRNAQASAFAVSFSHENPELTARVANEFASLIIDENLQARKIRASETQRFFRLQVAHLEDELEAMEKRIAQFKEANENSLPDSLAFRQNLAISLQAQISSIDQQLVGLSREKKLLRSSFSANPIVGNVDQNSPVAQLALLRSELTKLSATFSDSHPQVRSTRAQIDQLEKVLASQTESSDLQTEKDSSSEDGTIPIQNPQVAAQIANIEEQEQLLRRQRETLEARMAATDAAIAETPLIEVTLNALTREYENLQFEYRQARVKMAQAETGERLEEDRQSESFEIIEQAFVPTSPIKPNRPLIIAAAFLLGGAAGVGTVLLKELLDKSVKTSDDLARKVRIRPIATIPYITTDREVRRHRRQVVALVFGIIFASGAALSIVHYLYQPLDILGYKLLNRIGS
jgi:polysaccharide chain length determinant protein (PEP-CTERM system associated)